MRMPCGQTVPPQKQIRTMQTWHSSPKNTRLQCNRCCKSTSSPWQGHKRAVFNALMVLFPNAINSPAETLKRNFIFISESQWPREQERGVNTQSPPSPILSTLGATRDPPNGNPQSPGADLRVVQKRGLSIWPWLPSSTQWNPPRLEGKAIRWGAAPGGLQLPPSLPFLLPFLHDSCWQSWGALGFHLHLAFCS